MKIELNTNLLPIFSGTYNSIWKIYETDDNGNELEIDYNQNDLMKSIIAVYKKNEKYILSELNCTFIEKLKFQNSYFSPREYNFNTDQLDFILEIDETKLLATLNSLKNDALFQKFLKDNYSSKVN